MANVKTSGIPVDSSPTTTDYALGLDTETTTTKRSLYSVLINLFFSNVPNATILPNGLVAGTGTTWVLQSWTVTWTNVTVGNGTVTAKFVQIGKTVFGRLFFVLGSTSSISGQPIFSLPVTSVDLTIGGTAQHRLGLANFEDTTVNNYSGAVNWASTTTAAFVVMNAGGTYVSAQAVSATVPFSFGTGDSLSCSFRYDAP